MRIRDQRLHLLQALRLLWSHGKPRGLGLRTRRVRIRDQRLQLLQALRLRWSHDKP